MTSSRLLIFMHFFSANRGQCCVGFKIRLCLWSLSSLHRNWTGGAGKGSCCCAQRAKPAQAVTACSARMHLLWLGRQRSMTGIPPTSTTGRQCRWWCSAGDCRGLRTARHYAWSCQPCASALRRTFDLDDTSRPYLNHKLCWICVFFYAFLFFSVWSFWEFAMRAHQAGRMWRAALHPLLWLPFWRREGKTHLIWFTQHEGFKRRQEMTSERKPRLCLMTKADGGYGFHLHGEKGKSGQFIRKVEPGSPAEASGLRAGDRVVAVNGINVERETHHQVRVTWKVLTSTSFNKSQCNLSVIHLQPRDLHAQRLCKGIPPLCDSV